MLLSKPLEEYASAFTTPETPQLAALNRETNRKRGDAVMLSGHVQGAFLQMMSHMVRPLYALEIGTFTGYSAICLAQGLQAGGQLHTIEIDEELHDMGARYVHEAGLDGKVVLHTGSAIDIIPTLPLTFDLVFIDADKLNYCNYYDLVFNKVRTGGYILADNVLYDGEVVLLPEEQSKNARMIQLFNDKVKADTRVEHVLAPIRDGVMIIRKMAD